MAKSTASVGSPPAEPQHPRVKKAHLILTRAHDAARALLKAFDDSRGARRATGGQTTDEEQDLLRAMLVFAGAGLDSMCKQLVRDCLPVLAKTSKPARGGLAKFIARRLRDELLSAPASGKSYDVLASALASGSPQAAYIGAYVEELTGGSLQSARELSAVVAALGLETKELGVDLPSLGRVFHDRNRIVHEMDIDFSQKQRRRYPRRRGDMIGSTNLLLSVGAAMLAAADARLRQEASKDVA